MMKLPDWMKSLNTAGVKLAAVFATLATILAANQSLTIGLVMMLPTGPMKYVVAGVIGLIAFVIPTLTELRKPKKAEKTDD